MNVICTHVFAGMEPMSKQRAQEDFELLFYVLHPLETEAATEPGAGLGASEPQQSPSLHSPQLELQPAFIKILRI